MRFTLRQPNFVVVAALLANYCSTVQAHPGHSIEFAPSDSWRHYFVQPEHLAVTAFFLASSFAVWYFFSRPMTLKPLVNRPLTK